MSYLVNSKYFQEILQGKLPSEVFNKILLENTEIDKHELAVLFIGEFDLLDSSVIHLIWHWKSIKSIRGKNDEQLNESILDEMKKAGYKLL